MPDTASKKPALHGAAAESHRQAEHTKGSGSKDQPKTSNTKPAESGRAGAQIGNKSASGKKSR